MLRSDLCGYSDAYIVVKVAINVKADGKNDIPEKDVFKNDTPFRSWIKKSTSC